METALTQIGVGGIFAILVFKEILSFLAKKKNGGSEDATCYQTYLMVRKIGDEDLAAIRRLMDDVNMLSKTNADFAFQTSVAAKRIAEQDLSVLLKKMEDGVDAMKGMQTNLQDFTRKFGQHCKAMETKIEESD